MTCPPPRQAHPGITGLGQVRPIAGACPDGKVAPIAVDRKGGLPLANPRPVADLRRDEHNRQRCVGSQYGRANYKLRSIRSVLLIGVEVA
jgi:hypothetical protein